MEVVYSQVLTQALLLANLIHPSWQGKALTEEEVNTALEYPNEKFPSLVPIIMKFQAKSPPFHTFKFSDSVTKTMFFFLCSSPYVPVGIICPLMLSRAGPLVVRARVYSGTFGSPCHPPQLIFVACTVGRG